MATELIQRSSANEPQVTRQVTPEKRFEILRRELAEADKQLVAAIKVLRESLNKPPPSSS